MGEPGTVEIRSNTSESTGVVGVAWTVGVVPTVLTALHGIAGLETVTPETQPTGRTPAAQWTGVDSRNQPVIVFWWPDQAA